MGVYVRCNLRRLRKERGYSQRHLADLVGIDRGNLSKYERNEAFMNVVTAAKLAVSLGCTLEQLFDYGASAGEV